MGLIRRMREKADPWNVRLEEPRKTSGAPEAESDPEREMREALRRRRMFGGASAGKHVSLSKK